MMSWAAQTHLAGHMRPACRVFETPVLEHGSQKTRWICRCKNQTKCTIYLLKQKNFNGNGQFSLFPNYFSLSMTRMVSEHINKQTYHYILSYLIVEHLAKATYREREREVKR